MVHALYLIILLKHLVIKNLKLKDRINCIDSTNKVYIIINGNFLLFPILNAMRIHVILS